jgi:AcrR family transcriptional regulator
VKCKIVQKATDLFLTLGVKSVTMDDIARELSMSKKTIYASYNNKSSLVSEVVNSLFDKVSKGINEICAQELNPIEELYAIKKFVSIQLKNERVSPQFQLQKYYPELFEKFQVKKFERLNSITVQNVRRGMELGLYRDDLNIDFVARIYFVGMTGIVDDRIFPLTDFPKTHLVESFLAYHLRGIVTQKGLDRLKQLMHENTP